MPPDDPARLWPADFPASQPPPASLVSELASTHRLPAAVAQYLCELYAPLAAYIASAAQAASEPLLLGVNGAQATGKSTAAAILVSLLERVHGLRGCALSIDDVYLTRAERRELAQRVHPLLMTRGVPGTHDVGLARQVLEALRRAGPDSRTAIPRFDKASDDRLPPAEFDVFAGRPDVIIFEGWCVGARPEPPQALLEPCNDFERQEDPQGLWRDYANRCLADYQPLFAQLDRLVMLRAPSFEQIFAWRALQEHKLRDSLTAQQLATARVMSDAQLRRFISHYERLTRWILAELPERADITLQLNAEHRVDRVQVR